MEIKKNLDLKFEKETYKRAWSQYQAWYKSNGIMLSARTLFDFFDNNRIYIEITCDYDFSTKKVNNEWTYSITDNDNKVRIYGTKYDCRKTSEINAFKRAFKILEDKLIIIEKEYKEYMSSNKKKSKPHIKLTRRNI